MSNFTATFFDPCSARHILRNLGIRPDKKRGQSFMTDRNAARKIVRTAGVVKSDTVLEIGPGLGALTTPLLERAGRVIAIEQERRLAACLRERFRDYPTLHLIEGDALTADLRETAGKGGGGGRIKVVSNIPYSISTPLIAKLLHELPEADLLLLTVQRELAERIVAEPGNKAYGAFTLLCRYHANVRICFDLHPRVFYPSPAVVSSVVLFRPHCSPLVKVSDETRFFSFTRRLFSQRRKMMRRIIRNSAGVKLSPGEIERICAVSSIEPTDRPEQLSLDRIAKCFSSLEETVGREHF